MYFNIYKVHIKHLVQTFVALLGVTFSCLLLSNSIVARPQRGDYNPKDVRGTGVSLSIRLSRFRRVALFLDLLVFISRPKIRTEDNERVQIRVYRGPEDAETHFAPWGYFITQPVDKKGHRRRRRR